MNPNVLILMVDQLNYKCLSFKNHPVVKTPNLDRLKQDSVEFTRCYVQNAFCVPSRTSYFTGQYLFTHRQYGFHGLLSEDTPSMPMFFSENGYTTFHSGKAHVNCMGELLGFSTFMPTIPEDIAFATNMEDNYQVYCKKKGYVYPTDQIQGGDIQSPVRIRKTGIGGSRGDSTGTSHIPLKDSVEAYTSGKAINFLRSNPDDPFFLHVSFDRPHGPHSPSEPYDSYYDPEVIPLGDEYSEEQLKVMPQHIERYSTKSPNSVAQMGRDNMKKTLAEYYGLITHIDHEVGNIINVLKEEGLYDNTIIFFYSDHGDMAGYNGLFNKFTNTIFHDDIIRTPMLLKLVSQKNAGMEIDMLTESIDVFPTLAFLCGLDYSSFPLQGRNLADCINDRALFKDRMAFSESYGIKTVIKGDWKLIYYVNSNEGELYNLALDPCERENLFYDHCYSDKVTEMKMGIIKKMTKPVSERRKAFIRSLFDNTEMHKHNMMEKFHKWDRNIADGGGFWMVCRNGYRLIYIPFDDNLIFEMVEPDEKVLNLKLGMVSSDDREKREEMLNELVNYIATKIRPISLMSGKQEDWDNMLQSKGPGLC